MSFKENLKRERKKACLTQQKLAEKVGVSQTMIYQYETGRRKPKIQNLVKIANALEIEPTVLTGSTGIVGLTRRIQYVDAIKQIAEHYGYEHQKIKLVDEMSELTHAILDGRSIFDIADEMADVYIMLTEVEGLLDIKEQVDARMEYKVGRQLRRMKNDGTGFSE